MRIRSFPVVVVLSVLLLTLPAHAHDVVAPHWADMNAAQQQVLKPLAAEWDSYPAKQRQHLFALANKYPSMKADEKARIDARLSRWASMSKEDRIRARANYRKVQKLPPEQRTAVKRQLRQSHINKAANKSPAKPAPAIPAEKSATTPRPPAK